MQRAFVRAKSGCDKWHDYEMSVAPYETDKPIYYEFTACPAAEFAIKHGLTAVSYTHLLTSFMVVAIFIF